MGMKQNELQKGSKSVLSDSEDEFESVDSLQSSNENGDDAEKESDISEII
jgi:hypothetical protein